MLADLIAALETITAELENCPDTDTDTALLLALMTLTTEQ